MIEKATRIKLRFETVRGEVGIEDIWDMPLTSKNGFSLDDLAKDLYRKVKGNEEGSFVTKKSSKNELLELRFEIVKYIISVKIKEKEEKENATKLKAEKERLIALYKKKKDGKDEELSIDELKAKIDAMQ